MIECASETATPGRPSSSANSAACSLPLPTSRALCVSIQSTEPAMCAIDSSRRIEPRIRSNGWGRPTRPPCSRAAAMVSAADMPGGMARSRKRQMRSPSRVLTSSPTMIVSPAGASSRASSATSIRSWSVIARWVRPRAWAAFMTSFGADRQSKLPRVWQCRSTNARPFTAGSGPIRSAGPATF